MDYVHFFQWNIPKENHYLGRSDWYIEILAKWNGRDYIGDKPMVSIQPCNICMVDLRQVKNWALASDMITELVQDHFANISRQERINKARAELIAAGEIVDNPVLQRYEPNTAITLTDDLPY